MGEPAAAATAENALNGPTKININSAFWPVGVTCPKCNAEVMTECKYRWGLWNMCTLVYCQHWQAMLAPIWFKWYRDVIHVCPKCRAEICHIQKCPFCIKPLEEKKEEKKPAA